MTTFENLKSQWDNQSEIEVPNNGAQLIIEKTKRLRNKQQITNVILGITVMTLVCFFFYIAAYNNAIVALALVLMVGGLIVRMLIERLSIRRLEKINIKADANTFKQRIIRYYKNRVKTHYVLTPIVFVMYIAGFAILLPFFKQDLSYGFYIYILVSGITFLLVIALFIRKQIKKELIVIKELQN